MPKMIATKIIANKLFRQMSISVNSSLKQVSKTNIWTPQSYSKISQKLRNKTICKMQPNNQD